MYPGSTNFYPRSPCGERPDGLFYFDRRNIFLSTLSLRRATLRRNANYNCHNISIHALLAESDGGSGVGSWPRVIFLSTLSLRRATPSMTVLHCNTPNFYPRSPCGERQQIKNPLRQVVDNFYPRSPCGERRKKMELNRTASNFYPRSPCGERHTSSIDDSEPSNFYPRSPCGERRPSACLVGFAF